MNAAELARLIDESGTISVYFQGRKAGKTAVTPAVQITGVDDGFLSGILGYQVCTVHGRWICRDSMKLRSLLRYALPYLNRKRMHAQRLLTIVTAMPFYGGTPAWALDQAVEIRKLNGPNTAQ